MKADPIYIDRYGQIVDDIGEPMPIPPGATWQDCLRAIELHGFRKVTGWPDFDVRRRQGINWEKL